MAVLAVVGASLLAGLLEVAFCALAPTRTSQQRFPAAAVTLSAVFGMLLMYIALPGSTGSAVGQSVLAVALATALEALWGCVRGVCAALPPQNAAEAELTVPHGYVKVPLSEWDAEQLMVPAMGTQTFFRGVIIHVSARLGRCSQIESNMPQDRMLTSLRL